MAGLKDAKMFYIPAFLIRSLGIIVIFQVGFYLQTFKLLTYVFLGLNSIYTVIILIRRPYKKCLCNITILIEEFSTIFALCLSVMQNNTSISQSLEILLVYVLLIVLSIASLMTLLRLFFLYRGIFL